MRAFISALSRLLASPVAISRARGKPVHDATGCFTSPCERCRSDRDRREQIEEAMAENADLVRRYENREIVEAKAEISAHCSLSHCAGAQVEHPSRRGSCRDRAAADCAQGARPRLRTGLPLQSRRFSRAVPAAEASLLLLIAAARRTASASKPSRCRPPERDTVHRQASGMTLRSRRRGALGVAHSKDKESDLLFKGEGPSSVVPRKESAP